MGGIVDIVACSCSNGLMFSSCNMWISVCYCGFCSCFWPTFGICFTESTDMKDYFLVNSACCCMAARNGHVVIIILSSIKGLRNKLRG